MFVVSYARLDRPQVETLVSALRLLGKDVWLDDHLSGGQRWWDQILSEICRSEGLIFAVSPAALRSAACSAERQWAAAVGKAVLPVFVRPMTHDHLPRELAEVHTVDFSAQRETAALHLSYAVFNLPRPHPLPQPLPPRPPVPFSYLYTLAARVHSAELTLQEQQDLVRRLEDLLGSEDVEETLGARRLLGELRAHQQLYARVQEKVDALLHTAGPVADSRAVEQSFVPPPQPGRPQPVTQGPHGHQGRDSAPRPPASSTGAAPRSRSPRWIKILAGIGAGFIALMVWGASESSSQSTCYSDYYGNVICVP